MPPPNRSASILMAIPSLPDGMDASTFSSDLRSYPEDESYSYVRVNSAFTRLTGNAVSVVTLNPPTA